MRFVINTHWHQDHTSGNENLVNKGATVIAHENVRERLSNEQFVDFLIENISHLQLMHCLLLLTINLLLYILMMTK